MRINRKIRKQIRKSDFCKRHPQYNDLMFTADYTGESFACFVAVALFCAVTAIYFYYHSVQLANIGTPSQEVDKWLSFASVSLLSTLLAALFAFKWRKRMMESYQPMYQEAVDVSEMLTIDGNACYIEMLLIYKEERLRQNITNHLVELAESCLAFEEDSSVDLMGKPAPAVIFVENYQTIKESGWAEPQDHYFDLAKQRFAEIDADEAANGEGPLDEDEVIEHVTSLYDADATGNSQDPEAAS